MKSIIQNSKESLHFPTNQVLLVKAALSQPVFHDPLFKIYILHRNLETLKTQQGK